LSTHLHALCNAVDRVKLGLEEEEEEDDDEEVECPTT
jgi:hypothetical protein